MWGAYSLAAYRLASNHLYISLPWSHHNILLTEKVKIYIQAQILPPTLRGDGQKAEVQRKKTTHAVVLPLCSWRAAMLWDRSRSHHVVFEMAVTGIFEIIAFAWRQQQRHQAACNPAVFIQTVCFSTEIILTKIFFLQRFYDYRPVQWFIKEETWP